MSVQSISNLAEEPSTQPFIRPKVEWIGRQMVMLGKKLYSQLTKITVLFYQIIKTHPKKSLGVLTASIVTLLIYYKRKPLIDFLKSLMDPEKRHLQQKIEILSKQLSEKLQELQKLFPELESNIAMISTSQKNLFDKSSQIKSKHAEIKDELAKLYQPIPKDTQLKEHVEILEKKRQHLQVLETNIQNLLQDASDYKNTLLNLSNPFTS